MSKAISTRQLFLIILGAVIGFALMIPLAAFATEKTVTPSEAVLEPISSLNNYVVVEDDAITLGDIFTHAGQYAGRVVAYAPSPGRKAVFDAAWISQVARAYRLSWRPVSQDVRVVVERAAVPVDTQTIKNLVMEALVARGADPASRIQLGNPNLRMYMPTGTDPQLKVEQAVHDPLSGRFTAVLAWNSTRGGETLRLSGRLEAMSEVPVLAKRTMRGELIRADNIQWISLPTERLQRTVVLESDDLIGKSAKRTISSNQPIRSTDIRRPLLVTKGSSVTLTLQTPLMQLTARGRALEAGSLGDVIRISNSQTNNVIEAEITGAGVARVDTPANLAMK